MSRTFRTKAAPVEPADPASRCRDRPSVRGGKAPVAPGSPRRRGRSPGARFTRVGRVRHGSSADVDEGRALWADQEKAGILFAVQGRVERQILGVGEHGRGLVAPVSAVRTVSRRSRASQETSSSPGISGCRGVEPPEQCPAGRRDQVPLGLDQSGVEGCLAAGQGQPAGAETTGRTDAPGLPQGGCREVPPQSPCPHGASAAITHRADAVRFSLRLRCSPGRCS